MSEILKEFTTVVPFWEPRVKPAVLAEATLEQLEAMKVTVSDTKIGNYTLVLALDPETLQQRTPLFNGIMFHHGGLSRAETEFGAVAASVVNECIYCAAVHANRYNQLTKDESVMDLIFADRKDANLDDRQKSMLNFSTKLSLSPPEADKADVDRMVENGLGLDEIFDLTLSTSIFAWANRLMHILGEPHPQP